MSDQGTNGEGYDETNGTWDSNLVSQSIVGAEKSEIILPPAVDGKDRFITIEKISNETVSPLIKRDVSVDGIYEVIDRNFSYPLTAHLGLKFDSRTFSNVPGREYDVKMKKIKVPSNYFPLGGNGLDRRYAFSNPNYPANPTTLDVIFMVDQNMGASTRSLLRRNLTQFLSKLISGYTNVRASIWQTKNGVNTVINESTGDVINGFTYYQTDLFFELEVPDSAGNNQTNLYKRLFDALADNLQNSPLTDPAETTIANFFLRKSQFSITDQVGKSSEDSVLESIWSNTVRKVVYLSGSTPETMSGSTYQVLLNHARENCIQLYYFYVDAQFSGTRTLRELGNDSGGGAFNMQHDSDIKLQQFCDNNFYDSNKIYYGDWDGTFKVAWTDNPAWVLYDIITDVNYGLGNFIDSPSVDKWTLYDIGRYCDAVDDDGRFRGVPDGKGGLEPRYTCNIIFFNKDEAYKVIQDIAAIFKGIVYWNTEGFSFFADRPKEPVLYFGNANVKDGLFNYTETARNKRYTSVEIVYNDRYDNFKTKMELIEDMEGIRKYGINPFKVNAAGCTSRSEARRIGRYIICSSMFEADTVSFIGGLEAVYLQPGDIFAVSDEVRNVGRTFGRILDVDSSANTLKIDGEFQVGLASGIYIHVPSGNYSVSDLNQMTGSDGTFSGTLEQIRARRQKQIRKFNIHTIQDDSYGATITVTGDFLLQSAKTEVYAVEGRISGGGQFTGETVLLGSVYTFPDHTVLNGNPRWDAVTYENVTGVLSQNNIDITISGLAGTGQLISGEANWTGIISMSAGTVTVNGSSRGTAPSEAYSKILALNPDGTFASESNPATSVIVGTTLQTFVDTRSTGDIIIVTSRGSAFSNQESVASIFADYGATEVYKIGKDKPSSATLAYGYCAAFIKGGYRIAERASKNLNDFGTLKFTHRDLAAFSKLRPFYTVVQADVGNRQESVFPEWQAGRSYSIGNKVKFTSGGVSVPYICTRSHERSSEAFASDYDSSNAIRSKWAVGNNLGYSTVGFPKDFYGSSKVYLGTTLTSAHVVSAFNSLGIDIYAGGGTLGQTDIANLAESNGLGYSGLIIGTGYPRGFYDLNVDTVPRDLSRVQEGSLYVLSGSGVEPKLYKTIGVKEEEANLYSVVGIEYLKDKQDFVERDMIDTSPSVYVQSPYDIVIKPEPPARITSTGVTLSGSVPTGLNISWVASTSPITGYKIYVTRPDYSTVSVENDVIVEPYFVPSGTTSLTIPINYNWGQFDLDVYAQGVLYKFLSNGAASTGVMVLPQPTITVGGYTLTSTIPSGFTIDTADTKSLDYGLYHIGSSQIAGLGRGNFTSKDLTFRWKYIDPTGGIIDSIEKMLENPFLDLPPDISVQVLDEAGQALTAPIKTYDRFSYTITQDDNKKLVSRETTSWTGVEPTRNLGLRVVVKDNTTQTKTGNFYAYNVKPNYSRIDVVDSYQNSPYYILSGYFGNGGFTGLAFWGSGDNGVLGSGLRNYSTNEPLRSEDEQRQILYEDISGAFLHATGLNGTGASAAPIYRGLNISYKGSGSKDFKGYVYAYEDLIKNYNLYGKDTPIEVWGSGHYVQYGSGEGRQIPRTAGNPLGLSDLSEIPVGKTGFSGISFTVLTEDISKGEIIFNCYSATSNKDVWSVDVYTGDSATFAPDIIGNTNLYNNVSLYKTRTYLNEIRISERLQTGVWHYFRFVPWDDFGVGEISSVASGYLESIPIERDNSPIERRTINGGRDQNVEFVPTTTSLVRGFKYQIVTVGTINWTAIGASTNPAVGVEFNYNGTAVTGTGGRVKRVEVRVPIQEGDLNRTLVVDATTPSTMVLPADVTEGTSSSIINRGENNIYIVNSDGQQISVVRPGDRTELVRADNEWYDPRGNSLHLEA